MGRVEGKVAFVTGAARGQGRSHAIRLAEEGADIIAVDLLEEIPDARYPGATWDDLNETIRAVESLDRRIIATKADVRSLTQMRDAVDAGVAELGHLDIVVANAGIMILHEWEDGTEELWQNTIDTNLTGVWNTVMATAPHLVKAGGGSIIATSSAAGLKGQPFLNPYVAAKHGVVGVMRAFATELSEHNIRVNTIHPTGVKTTMVEGLDEFYPKVLQTHPRLGAMLMNLMDVEMIEPRDISNAVVFLASDEARYVTSVTFPVDAGNTQV